MSQVFRERASSCTASILTGHVTHWACLGCSGSAYTTACSSSCQYPATSHSHWRGVDQHPTINNLINSMWRRCDALREANSGHTRYWLRTPPNTVKLHILEWIFTVASLRHTLCNNHGWKNIIYSSTWQRLSFLSSLQLQLYSMTFTIQLGSSTITPSASVRNLGVIFDDQLDLQRAHCKDCSILQVCTTQHQKDQAPSDTACCTTSCPGPCHF